MKGFVSLLLSIWIRLSVSLLPEEQPGCLFRPEIMLFFAYNAHVAPNAKNWLCEESFEEKLRICIEMFQRTSQGKVETSYEIVKDKESVSRECQKRKITFEQLFESGEPEYVANDTIRNTTIEVKMFACPITKMDLKFPVKMLTPELFDIYISLGRNDVTVAVLRDSVHLDNICVRDTYLYPPPHLRDTPRPEPFWPEEIYDYGKMDEEYFQGLASRMMARQMATATGPLFEDNATTSAMTVTSGQVSKTETTTCESKTSVLAVSETTIGTTEKTTPRNVSARKSTTKATISQKSSKKMTSKKAATTRKKNTAENSTKATSKKKATTRKAINSSKTSRRAGVTRKVSEKE